MVKDGHRVGLQRYGERRERTIYGQEPMIWLICKDGKLGCDVCCEVSSLGIHKSKNVYLSQEWQSIGIVPSGSTKEKQLTSLRN